MSDKDNDSVSSWVLPAMQGKDLSKIKKKAVPKNYEKQAEIKLAKLKAEYDKARKEGYDKGYEEGRALGLQEYKNKIEQVCKLFGSVSHSLKSTDELIVSQVLDLTKVISMNIIKHELSINTDILKELITDIMNMLPDESRDIVLELNKLDLEALKEDNAEFIEKLDNVKLIFNDSIAQGGCILKSRDTKIDASIESRLHELLAKIGGEYEILPTEQAPEQEPDNNHE